MYDQKEIEELYDEFLNLDGNMFLECDQDLNKMDNDFHMNNLVANAVKNLPNLRNNNFLSSGSIDDLDEPNVSIQLDLLNRNFGSLNNNDFSAFEKFTTSSSEQDAVSLNDDKPLRPTSLFAGKKYEIDVEVKEIDEKRNGYEAPPTRNNAFHSNDWGPESLGLWHSGPSSLYSNQPTNNDKNHQESSSVVSYTSCGDAEPQSLNIFSSSSRTYSHQQLGVKVEMVYNLLSMLDTNNREDMSKTFLAMSSSPESCHAMRQSGCLPLLIQLIHSPELDLEVRNRAAEALYNIVDAQTDEKRRRREMRVLKLLQQVREYCNELKGTHGKEESCTEDEAEKHPLTAMGALMKFSFDAEHRQAICTLGGLHAITDLIRVDHEAHGSSNDNVHCVTLRRYAGMSLTNLTFGDGKNKALLCSFNKFMRALVGQLKSPSEDLRQVTASVLRNLSWRADTESKQALRDVGAVTALTVAAIEVKKESTLKSILSALWNLSAHCSMNKVDICSVPGALAFLVKMLKYKSTSNTLAIVENAGGIIRNISSHIAVREDYRQILRDNNCFEILLEHLKSPSLTIVSNACGTLWNLSARCSEDQRKLWEMGATTMLRSLIQSKHKMISMGSSAALKNLLTANPNGNLMTHLDSTAKSLGLQSLPTLFVRKQRALEQELNITLAETCDNIEPSVSPTLSKKTQDPVEDARLNAPKRSDSHESIRSTQSDSVYERLNQIVFQNENKMVENKNTTLHESLNEKQTSRKVEDQKIMKRYRASMIPTPTLKKMNQDKLNEKTKEEALLEEDAGPSFNETDLKTKADTHVEAREQVKRGIPVLKLRQKCKSNLVSDKNWMEGDYEYGLTEEQRNNSGYTRTIEDHQNTSNDFEPAVRSVKTNLGKSDFSGRCSDNISEPPSEGLCNVSQPSPSSINLIESKDDRKVSESGGKDFASFKLESSKNTSLSKGNIISEVGGKEPGKSRVVDCVQNVNAGMEPNSSTRQQLNSLCSSQKVIQSALESSDTHTKNNQPSFPSEDLKLKGNTSPLLNSRKEVEKLKGLNINGDNVEKPNDILLPNFKIGSEITNSKILQYEANKICREIQRHQEIDMGCSLTSEVSLISCSSFLDAADYSLFEASTDGVDFEETDDLNVGKASSKSMNFSFRKNLPSQSGELVSLPSLGSLKNDPIEGIDLEGSIVSVASITSEIAEMCSKDKESFNTYTKTYKNDEAAVENIDDTIDDCTLLSDGKENVHGQSNDDFDDDNSLNSQENLPLDPETNVKNCTTDQTGRRMTPKERRKTFHERYRTYTIRDVKGNLTAEADQAASSQKMTPKQKRMNDKDRFLTRTIEKGDPNLHRPGELREEFMNGIETNEVHYINNNFDSATNGNFFGLDDRHENEKKPFDCTFANFYPESKYELLKSSKSFDKNFDHIQTLLSDSRSLNDLLSIGPAERKELVDNAKLVAFSLKTAACQDFDSEALSDSETEGNKTLTIDTATYNKKTEGYRSGRVSYEEYENSDFETECVSPDLQERKGPKILKSEENLEREKTKEFSKGIRGRRKQLYSSPYRQTTRSNISTPASPKLSQTSVEPQKYNLVTTKSLPNVSRNASKYAEPPAFNREGTFTKEESTTAETSSARNGRGIPSLTKNTSVKGPAVSTNTVVRSKSGSVLRNAKPASEPSRIAKPSFTSRNNERRIEGSASQRRHTSFETGSRISGNSARPSRSVGSSPHSQDLKNSPSNQSLKSSTGATVKGVTGVRSKNAPLQASKSLSNASLNSASANEKGKPKTPKKEVTSRIASLWKKVEESKQKTKNSKDNRVWIGPEKDSKKCDEVLCVEHEEIVDIPTRKIVHSYTCEELADGTPEPKPDKKGKRASGNFH